MTSIDNVSRSVALHDSEIVSGPSTHVRNTFSTANSNGQVQIHIAIASSIIALGNIPIILKVGELCIKLLLRESPTQFLALLHSNMSRHPRSVPSIILYDIPGHSPQPWAPNIWRIRFVLNFKRLRYRTVWVELPDIEATLRSIGAPPSSYHSDGRPVYTLPVIVDPTRSSTAPTVLSNPNNIAEYLESLYPARPIYPEGSRALQTLFVHYIQEVFAKPLLTIMVPLSYRGLTQRGQSFAHPSTHSLPPGPERERAWMLVKEQFDFLASVLDKNVGDGDGVCAMGHHVSYADFALCSVLIWIESMAALDGWSRVREWNGGRWLRLKDRCKDYMDVC